MSASIEIQIIAVIVAVSCSLLGSFLILRRMSMMCDSITHTILLGIVIAFFITKDLSSPFLIVGAALIGVITVWLTETLTKTRLLGNDSAIGVVFPLLFSIAIILITKFAGNVHLDTDSVLLGELAFAPFDRMIVGGVDIGAKAIYTTGILFIINLLAVIIFFKELKVSTFDPMLAAVMGFTPAVLHYGLMVLVSLTTVGSFQAVGSILVMIELNRAIIEYVSGMQVVKIFNKMKKSSDKVQNSISGYEKFTADWYRNNFNYMAVFQSIVPSTITVVFVFIINPYVGLFVAVIAIVVIIVASFMNRSGVKHSAIRQEQNENLTQAVISHIEGIGVIKSYNLLGEKSEDLTDNFRKTRDAALKFEFTQIPWMFALNFLYTLGMTGVLAIALYLFTAGGMTLPYLIGCILYCFSIFLPLKALYGDASRLTVMNACLDRIENVFNEKTLQDNGTKSLPKQSDAPEVSFEKVTFAYGDNDTIKNVSFQVKRNSMTALVGVSGGGKSTLANLLARFWDVKSGSIKVRGIDIRDVPLSELMNHISMVFQKVYLFQDTVYNNIAMGRPDASRSEVEDAAKRARCYDFIMSLPNQFETIKGEGGASLSGGEKQRISIARCILKDAPIIILYEATASVDLDNERYIQEAINELIKGKTLLVIAHRLNTIRTADRILVIDNGEIKEEGTHDVLMQKKGIYCNYVTVREKRM